MTVHSDNFIPVRGLNEFIYCSRLYHLMYVQGLFDDSADTLEGNAQHQRRRMRSKKATTESEEDTVPWPKNKTKNIVLSDSSLGITGKFDIVIEEGKETFPVEDKHGPAPNGKCPFYIGPIELSGCAWDNDQLQLAAQMDLLRANGYNCKHGKLFYRKTGSLVNIPWSESLKAALEWVVDEIRKLRDAPMPEPLHDSPKCLRCSLNHICLPDETQFLKGKLKEPRRLHPGRDDAGILYLTTPGARLTKSGENLKVVLADGSFDTIPIKEVAHLCVFGNSQVTTQSLFSLISRGVTITYFTSGGWLQALTSAPITKNVMLRKNQFLRFSQTATNLKLSRSIVAAKIANQRTLLRRNRTKKEQRALVELKRLQREAENAESIESLRGMEGAAARIYWQEFSTLLHPPKGSLSMDGRNRRPPKDPVNAMLSYGYTLLLRDFSSALLGIGFDPLFGFYHAMVPGRPALALDLMEAFRPLIVDSTVLRAVNDGSISPNDFLITPGNCAFKKSAKYRWISAYEHRVDELITHPAFGYRLSYRRVFHIEARLLARFLEGELEEYRPLMTR